MVWGVWYGNPGLALFFRLQAIVNSCVLNSAFLEYDSPSSLREDQPIKPSL